MPIDAVTAFTPWASLTGGVLIGLSAVLVMLVHGRIAGISGITRGALPGSGDWIWRMGFLAGLILAPLAWLALTGERVAQTVPGNWLAMAAAGLLVGIGTTLGSGCTSGHGVCGLARLSVRSLVAVLCFFASAVITVWLLRHGAG